MSPANFVRQGYTVEPASNGGFVVRTRLNDYSLGGVAAFTTYRDLLDWLEAAHINADRDATKAAGDVPAAE